MTVRRLVLLLALPVLALAGCATEQATDDPAAAPSAVPTAESAPPEVAGMCAEGEPDCEDMVTVPPSALPDGGGFADTCLAGATECADIPSADPAAPPDGVQPQEVEPREGLVDVTGVPWVEVQPNDDQTALIVTWWGGNLDCQGLDHVEVDETDEAVTLTVLTGREPDVEICTEEAIYLATTVELSGELGPRSILDGTVADS